MPEVKPIDAAFEKLSLGSIRADGWLRKQLQLQADGFAGRLTEISAFLQKKDNAWLSPTGEGTHPWEEVPYWLRGFVSLAYGLNDSKLKKEAKFWIEAILASQREDGYFGPRANLRASNGKPDVWPNMLAVQALILFEEATKDPRVVPFLTKYFRWQQNLQESDFLTGYWESCRVADNLVGIQWLHRRIGGDWLIELAHKAHRRSIAWGKGVANLHGVNFAQGFREPMHFGALTGDPKLMMRAEHNYNAMRNEYGQVPGGMYGADENARKGKTDPRQAAETCAMVEMMFSANLLFAQTGEPRWGDRCEDIAFNSLPASMTADLRSLHYLTSPNMVQLDRGNKSPGLQNGGAMLSFNARDYRCCQHNTVLGWPTFAEYLWMRTPDGGLLASLYAPNKLSTVLPGNHAVSIHEETNYPFEEAIRFRIALGAPTKFPLLLRIPSWCRSPSVRVNQIQTPVAIKNGLARIERSWKNGDVLTLALPMTIETKTWSAQHSSVSVHRGPLAFSLKIDERTEVTNADDPWSQVEVFPASDWNFGLTSRQPKFTVKRRPFPKSQQPFDPRAVPIELETQGRSIPEWRLDHLDLVPPLQPSPAFTKSPARTIRLIPMGAARLRISMFPTTSAAASATHWKPPRARQKPLPTKASHVSWFDTTDALSDGMTPGSSADDEIPRFTWWDHKGTTEWVQYDLPAEKTITSSEVYWFDDTGHGGCRIPASYRLLVLRGSEWQEVAWTSRDLIAKDKLNVGKFEAVKGKSFRLEVQLQPGWSGGILEWKLK